MFPFPFLRAVFFFLATVSVSFLLSACGSDNQGSDTRPPELRDTTDSGDPNAKKKKVGEGDEESGGADEKRDDSKNSQRASSRFGTKFAKTYENEYAAIAAEVGFTTNACAAFATAALRRVGVENIPYELWAPSLVEHLRKAGWKKVTTSRSLKLGDLVFTRDSKTERDGLTNHVFVFAGYVGSDKESARAIDNQNNGYERNLGSNGSFSPFWFAYRFP
jgi:hypothetical protein